MVIVWIGSPHALLREALACSLRERGITVLDDPNAADVALLDLVESDIPFPPAPHPTSVALVRGVDASIVYAVKRSGYRGLHPIGDDHEVLTATLTAVAGGAPALDAWLSRVVAPAETPNLTRREAEVLDHVRLGLPNKLIGRRLGIAERTVKHHVSALMRKFGVRDRMSLVVRHRDERGRSERDAAH
jgi:DNA-binding NarL/FixJ family response regulator